MDKNVAVCTLCKRREAFYFRPYSGEKLCRKCFAESIETKVRATIAKYKMLEFDSKIAVAVSGGKDSVSLLHILAKIVEKDYPKASLTAITVDEGIRGYRDEALKIARKNCQELGVEHHVISFKELYGFTLDEIVKRLKQKKEKTELTPCAYCGVMRRKALNFLARKVGADKLATAHTLDDETQTILLNIFHGDILRIAREKPVKKPSKTCAKSETFLRNPREGNSIIRVRQKNKVSNHALPLCLGSPKKRHPHNAKQNGTQTRWNKIHSIPSHRENPTNTRKNYQKRKTEGMQPMWRTHNRKDL